MRSRFTSAAALAVLSTACGGATVEGTYTGQGNTIIDALTFKPDGKVDVRMTGLTHQAAYEIDGSIVTVVAPNGTLDLADPFGVFRGTGRGISGRSVWTSRARSTAKPSDS